MFTDNLNLDKKIKEIDDKISELNREREMLRRAKRNNKNHEENSYWSKKGSRNEPFFGDDSNRSCKVITMPESGKEVFLEP